MDRIILSIYYYFIALYGKRFSPIGLMGEPAPPKKETYSVDWGRGIPCWQ